MTEKTKDDTAFLATLVGQTLDVTQAGLMMHGNVLALTRMLNGADGGNEMTDATLKLLRGRYWDLKRLLGNCADTLTEHGFCLEE